MLDLKDKRVIVTGGIGFIGSHLVRSLISLGIKQVLIIDSYRYGKPENLDELLQDPRIQNLKFDLASDDFSPVTQAIQNYDYLFHLAAEKHNQSKDSPERVIAANITGTLKLFEAAAKAGVKKIVFTSSLYAYGMPPQAPFHEQQIPVPDTVYGISKLTGEQILNYIRKTYSIEGVCLRYFFVYGPRQFAGMGYKSVIMKNFENIMNGRPPVIFGDGKQALDYVFVDDVVEATLKAMQVGKDGAFYNIASTDPVTVNRLTEEMLKVANSKLAPIFGPADWTHQTIRYGTNDLARRELDWKPQTPLASGLQKTFEWLRNNT